MSTTVINGEAVISRKPPSSKRSAGADMWRNYRVSWTFVTKLCASIPADPKLIEIWTRTRMPKAKPAGGKSIEDIQAEVFETVAQGEEEPSLLVFQRVSGALAVRAGTIKAHIKDCARILSSQFIGKIQGERSFATRVINGVYPDPAQYWIPILRPDGKLILNADGTHDKAVHARGVRGEPINALKCFEFVNPARLDFTLKVLGKSASTSDLEHLFQYGGVHGYAGERGDGEGKYLFELEEIDGAK